MFNLDEFMVMLRRKLSVNVVNFDKLEFIHRDVGLIPELEVDMLVVFPNGYAGSILKSKHSVWYEIALVRYLNKDNYYLVYDSTVMEDIVKCDFKELVEILVKMSELEEVNDEC